MNKKVLVGSTLGSFLFFSQGVFCFDDNLFDDLSSTHINTEEIAKPADDYNERIAGLESQILDLTQTLKNERASYSQAEQTHSQTIRSLYTAFVSAIVGDCSGYDDAKLKSCFDASIGNLSRIVREYKEMNTEISKFNEDIAKGVYVKNPKA